MANDSKVLGSIKAFLERMKAHDGDIPEEIGNDALEMVEEVKDALAEEETEKVEEEVKAKDEAETEEKKEEIDIDKKVEDAICNALRKYGIVKDGAMVALDELENKLGKEGEDEEEVISEEEVTVDPEKMNDSARLALLRKVKPVIANVKDAKSRKVLSDSFAEAIGYSRSTADYGKIMNCVKNNVNDSMSRNTKTNDSDFDFGMEIAKKYNPHYMKEGI